MLRKSTNENQKDTDDLKLAELKKIQAKCDDSLLGTHKALVSYVTCLQETTFFSGRRCSSLEKEIEGATNKMLELSKQRDELFSQAFPSGSTSPHEVEATKAKHYNCRQLLAMYRIPLRSSTFTFLQHPQERVYRSLLEMLSIKCDALKDRAEILQENQSSKKNSGP